MRRRMGCLVVVAVEESCRMVVVGMDMDMDMDVGTNMEQGIAMMIYLESLESQCRELYPRMTDG